MTLSKLERLVLVQQFLALEKLYPDEAEYYQQHRTALERGYELDYESLFAQLSDGLDADRCRELLDILNLHRALHVSYSRLPDKNGINPADISFRGFDGNEESTELGYVEYYLRDLGRYKELLPPEGGFDDLNTHSSMLWWYRRMLGRWQAYGKSYDLSKQEILQIVSRDDIP